MRDESESMTNQSKYCNNYIRAYHFIDLGWGEGVHALSMKL